MQFTTMRDQLQERMPELSSEAVCESLEMANFLSQNGLIAFREEYGDQRLDRIIAKRDQNHAYVVHDSVNDLYFKSYEITEHAVMQQRVMNALHQRLVGADIGIAAVRHLALIQPSIGTAHPVALIETAQGESLRAHYKDYYMRRTAVRDVRHRLNQALGIGIRRVLVNDINRMGNDGGKYHHRRIWSSYFD